MGLGPATRETEPYGASRRTRGARLKPCRLPSRVAFAIRKTETARFSNMPKIPDQPCALLDADYSSLEQRVVAATGAFRRHPVGKSIVATVWSPTGRHLPTADEEFQ